MADALTPAEQRFFETGELQPGMVDNAAAPAPAPAPAPAVDPLALAGVGSAPAPAPAPAAAPAPAPGAAAPAQAPAAAPAQPDVVEVLRRSLAEAHQTAANLQAQLQATQQRAAAPAPAPAPDKAIDPLGAMFHELETVNATVKQLQEALAIQQQQNVQFNNFQQFQTHVAALKDQFAKTTPDFQDAYSHLRNTRAADLRLMGYQDADIQKTIFQEEVALSEAAIRLGKNPAEAVYEMSKRHGYTSKQAPAPAPAPDDKLAAIQRAQQAARTLPATPVNEDITLEGLNSASDADLNAVVMDPKAWSKIVGADTYPL